MRNKNKKTNLLFAGYRKNRQKIRKRLDDFSKIREDEYFYELCFCLLTPQSSAQRCWETVTSLKMDDFKNRNFHPLKYLEKKVRFHNHKSEYLLEWKKKHAEVLKGLKSGKNSFELREYLVKNIKGLGYKEASHFLRNIGHKNLAILDRHILKNLRNFGAVKKMPNTLTKKNYLAIEKKFQDFAKKTGIPMDELDLLFWSMETGEIFK